MHPGLLVGAGFLLGTVGIQAAKSQPARRACVKSIACGMRMRDAAQTLVDEAKAEFDDIVAEAGYEAAAEEAETEAEVEAVAEKAKAKAKPRTRAKA